MERKNKFKSKHSYFLSLAFEQAKNNCGFGEDPKNNNTGVAINNNKIK